MFSIMLMGRMGPKNVCPILPETSHGPEGSTYKAIIKDDGVVFNQLLLLKMTDNFDSVILSTTTCVLKVTRDPKMEPTRRYIERMVNPQNELHALLGVGLDAKKGWHLIAAWGSGDMWFPRPGRETWVVQN